MGTRVLWNLAINSLHLVRSLFNKSKQLRNLNVTECPEHPYKITDTEQMSMKFHEIS